MGGFSLTSDVCASAALPKRAIASAHTPTDKRLLMLLSLREVVPGVVAQPRSEFLGHASVLLPRSSKWKDRTSDWHDRKGARLEISQARDDLFNLFARRCPAEAEANGTHSDFQWNLHRLQYRRKLYRSGVAGGARRS